MTDEHALSDKPLGPGALPRTVGIELPTNEIAAALAAAQAKITSPPRNREVVVKMKTGGSYKFAYSTLDCIIDHVRKPLTDNGLWFTQTLKADNGKYLLVTRLLHSSGQSIISETPLLLEGGTTNQAFGSALSYMRRNILCGILGIAAESDEDANVADGNAATNRPKASADKQWRGPLNVTALRNKVNDFTGAVAHVTDLHELTGLEADNQKILDQCIIDLPDYYYGIDQGDGTTKGGALNAINAKRNDLEEHAALQAPPMDDRNPIGAG